MKLSHVFNARAHTIDGRSGSRNNKLSVQQWMAREKRFSTPQEIVVFSRVNQISGFFFLTRFHLSFYYTHDGPCTRIDLIV